MFNDSIKRGFSLILTLELMKQNLVKPKKLVKTAIFYLASYTPLQHTPQQEEHHRSRGGWRTQISLQIANN